MRESNNAMAPTKAVDDNGDDGNDDDDDGDDDNDDDDNSQSARCVLFDASRRPIVRELRALRSLLAQIEWASREVSSPDPDGRFLETIVLPLPPSATSTTKRNKCSQYYCR